MILDSDLDIGVTYDPLHLTATFCGEVWEEAPHIDAIPLDVVKLVARAGRYYFYLAYDRDTPGEIRPARYFVIGD